jgi:putative hydrolase of the HAD superfamily
VLFLDLDDTIYPGGTGLWEAIGDRINEFIIKTTGLSAAEAARLRERYFRDYGTTLNGLRLQYGIDPYDYLRYVHDVPLESFIARDDRLREMLMRIHARRIIFTNSDRSHVGRVLAILGVADLIETVIDIVALEWINKPDPRAYARALALSGNPDPAACVIVDDQVRNLLPASNLGMTTVVVNGESPVDGVDHTIRRLPDLLDAVPSLAGGDGHHRTPGKPDDR